MNSGRTITRVLANGETYVEFQRPEPAIGIRCVLTLPNAKLPSRAHESDSGLDLYTPEEVELQPGIPCFVDLGVVLELPPGYEGQIRSRSGLTKQGLAMVFGTVDSGYRGNLGVTLLWHTAPGNGGEDTWKLAAGTRIAQLVVMPVPRVELVQCESVEQLSKTARGDRGFGSTDR
jgi:dUTP pyrophosphatase